MTAHRTRHIPASLAPVLKELELEQPRIVTKELLADLIARTDVSMNSTEVAERLQRHGWLVSLRTQGAWEFAPASRADCIGSGDPLIELRATLIRRPEFKVAVAYDSAAWINNLSQRPPGKHVIAIGPGQNIPHALRNLRVTRNWAKLDPLIIDDLPVWRIESLLILISAYPNAYRDWPNIGDWLPEAVEQADSMLLMKELQGRRRATWARTGYLLDVVEAYTLGERIHHLLPSGRGPVYLGKRGVPAHYNKRWEVVDSLLPHSTLSLPGQHHGQGMHQDRNVAGAPVTEQNGIQS